MTRKRKMTSDLKFDRLMKSLSEWVQVRGVGEIPPIDSSSRERLVLVLAEVEDHFLLSSISAMTEADFRKLFVRWSTSTLRILADQDLGALEEVVIDFFENFDTYEINSDQQAAMQRASVLQRFASALFQIVQGQLIVFVSKKTGKVVWL